MHTAWRWLLITWLVLALPLQGAVAATLRHCAVAGAAMVQADADAAADAHAHAHAHAHALHHHGDAHAEGHHPGMGAPGAALPDAGPGHPAQVLVRSTQPDHAGQCSVCAACCPAMAPVMPGLDGPAPQPGALRYGRWTAAAPPEGWLAGLERPPRLNLA